MVALNSGQPFAIQRTAYSGTYPECGLGHSHGGEIAQLVRARGSDPGDRGTNPGHCYNI